MSLSGIVARWFSNYDNEQSVGSRLRARRIAPLLQMIDEVHRQHGRVDMIDMGGRENYWSIVPADYLEARDVSITIVNIPGSEIPADHGLFKFIAADCCDLSCVDDNAFHIAHSNSVIEHVGDWNHMVQFANEVARVAQKYFVQTPNYWFPIEPHFMAPFFQWLPEPMRVWLVLHFQLGHRARAATIDAAVREVESVRLLNRKMLQELFKDAELLTERFFLLPKSLMAIRK